MSQIYSNAMCFLGPIYLGQTFTTPGDVDNADSSARFNNALKWASPSWYGLNGELMYGFGGVAGSVVSGQTYSAALSYGQGGFTFAGGYLHMDRGNPTLSTRGTASSDTLFNSSVNAAYASAKAIDVWRVATQYAFSAVTVGAYYSDSRIELLAHRDLPQHFGVRRMESDTRLAGGGGV
ncbi:porin [Paraburkholderia hospita]|uniref:porin n=1 Tax=Paraburkholderia hospita TaxID=169430 RepID=UPI003ECE2769